MSLRTTQLAVWNNKRAKGFNTTDVPLEFCLLQGEIAELFEAWHGDKENLAEELADVAIYLLGLSQMMSINLEQAIYEKMVKNSGREYERSGRRFVKVIGNQKHLSLVPQSGDQFLF